MDYGLEPPEINSGRIYAGVGPGPMLAAAAAWSALGGELDFAAAAHAGTVGELVTGPWMGPSAVMMGVSGAQSVEWLVEASAQCFQASAACSAAAAAFSEAFAGVTPPPAIVENRTRLATLIATNFFGVNSAAIAATEAQYAEMWAQTSGTLYNYAAQSAATAGSLVPLRPMQPNTNPAGLAAQGAATAASAGQSAGTTGQTMGSMMSSLGQLPQMASGLLQSGSQSLGQFPKMLSELAKPLTSLLQPLTQAGQQFMGSGVLNGLANGVAGGVASLAGFAPMASAASAGASGFSGAGSFGGVAATMGKSVSLGGSQLSVPAQWVSAAKPEKAGAVARPIEMTEQQDGNNSYVAAPRAGTGAGMIPASAMGNQAGMGAGAPHDWGTITRRPSDQGGLRSKLIGDLTGI